MEKREYGTNPTAECRHDAHEVVDKKKKTTRHMGCRVVIIAYKTRACQQKVTFADPRKRSSPLSSARDWIRYSSGSPDNHAHRG